MLDTISNILRPETYIAGVIILVPLLILSTRHPEVVLALGCPAWMFAGQLQTYFAISVSAVSAFFPIIALAGGIMKGYRFRLGRIECTCALLGMLVLYSVRYSLSPVYGSEKAILVLGQSLPVVLVASFTLVSFEAIKRALNVIGLSLVVYIIVSVMMRYFAGSVEDRFGALHDVIVAARVIGLGAIACLYWWWPQGGAWRAVVPFLVLASVGVSLMSGTRTVIVAMLATVLAVQYLGNKSVGKLRHLRLGRFFVVVWGVFFFLLFGEPLLSGLLPGELYATRYGSWQTFSRIGNFEEPSARVLNYTVAWEGAMESPLRGLGAGGYKDLLLKYRGRVRDRHDIEDERHPIYPHNMVLEFFCEQGIPGLLLFSLVVYHAVKILLRVRAWFPILTEPQRRVAVMVSAFFIYGFVTAQTSLDIPRQYIFWWGLGMLTALSHVLHAHLRVCPTASEQTRQDRAIPHRPSFRAGISNSSHRSAFLRRNLP